MLSLCCLVTEECEKMSCDYAGIVAMETLYKI